MDISKRIAELEEGFKKSQEELAKARQVALELERNMLLISGELNGLRNVKSDEPKVEAPAAPAESDAAAK